MKAGAIMEKIMIKKVSKMLNGDSENLYELIRMIKEKTNDPGILRFFVSLEISLFQGTPLSRIFLNLGQNMSEKVKEKIIENLIYHEFIRGEEQRRAFRSGGNWVPSLLVISPTMRCNLRCKGCYSGLYGKDQELTNGELENILLQARELGIYFIVISGGEPFIRKETIFRLLKEFDDMFFLIYTNGTYLDNETAEHLAVLGNAALAISVEGWKEETEGRRGAGMWEKINAAMDNLRKAGVFFGISMTQTRQNIGVLLNESFLHYFVQKGALFGWYFMFMPVGKDPDLHLVPTPEQRYYSCKKVIELRNTVPMFLADFWNDGPAAGGCLAGGRSYMHILHNGNVEPCVFAHFGVDNIRKKSLLEAANSDFFKDIRKNFPYNENGNLKRPCMIIDNPHVLREVVESHHAHYGHPESESLIHDQSMKLWINQYAARFSSLVAQDWETEINDPKSRWYKHGKEYNDLFRFQKESQ